MMGIPSLRGRRSASRRRSNVSIDLIRMSFFILAFIVLVTGNKDHFVDKLRFKTKMYRDIERNRRHRGASRRKLLVATPPDQKLMKPVAPDEFQLDDVKPGCLPLCIPAWKLPIDPTVVTRYTDPRSDPERLGLSKTTAAKILTYPPPLKGAPMLIPSYYGVNNPHVYRQPDPGNMYDRIDLYRYAPYRSVANPPSGGTDDKTKKSAWVPMVPLGPSTVSNDQPLFRPLPFLTSNYDRAPTQAWDPRRQSSYGFSLGAYPNMSPVTPGTRPAKNSEGEVWSGIPNSPPKKYEVEPAKVSSFLELATSSVHIPPALRYGTKFDPAKKDYGVKYDYRWLLSPATGNAVRRMGSPRWTVTHDAEDGDMMRMPPNLLYHQTGPPMVLSPPTDPPPPSLMGFGFL